MDSVRPPQYPYITALNTPCRRIEQSAAAAAGVRIFNNIIYTVRVSRQDHVFSVVLCTLYTRFVLTGHIGMPRRCSDCTTSVVYVYINIYLFIIYIYFFYI